MAADQFLIETDVLASFLRKNGDERTLLDALAAGVCYTTSIQAIELFEACTSDSEREAVTHVLSLVRVLGLHPKISESVAALSSQIGKGTPLRDAITIGMAHASKLTIISRTRQNYFRAMLEKAELQFPVVVSSIADLDKASAELGETIETVASGQYDFAAPLVPKGLSQNSFA